MSFNNALVAVSTLPGGLVFGFYVFFRAFISDDEIPILWPLITAPVCALVVSCVITVKKRIQEKYTYDNLYYNSLACAFYIVSGLFFMRHSLDIACYFGFAGHGISYISSVTYAGYTAGSTTARHRAIGGVHLFFFIGVAVASVLHAFISTVDEAENKCGLILIGSGIVILGILISNQILNYCSLNNYRTSHDNLWNYYNVRNWLYKNRPDTMAIHQRMDNRYRQATFAIIKSKESITVFFILLVSVMNFMMFCNVTLGLGFSITLSAFKTGGFLWLMVLATGGIAIGITLQACLSPTSIFTICGIIKCAALVCVLLFFDSYSQPNPYIFYYLVYFFCMGVLYSVPITMLLEVANPRNCEIVLSGTYFLQIVILHIVLYFNQRNSENMADLNLFVRILYIVYIVLSALAIVVIQIFGPISGSLIEIRNHLIGIRKSKTIVSFRDF